MATIDFLTWIRVMYTIHKKITLVILILCVTACNLQNRLKSTSVVSTAQPEVVLIKEPLIIPRLNRARQIRLYLPPGYATSGKSYPVIYMHDGQNLFDVVTGNGDEWRVDEVMNALSRAGTLELIVVGIDNGGEHRITELNPWQNPQYPLSTYPDFRELQLKYGPFGEPEGKEYMEFVVKVVKPFIDKQYRTKADRANTAIMGSSMGGLITHYAITQYPEVFSKAGIFSPSYWAGRASFDFIAEHPVSNDARLYFVVGDKEPGSMMIDTQQIYATAVQMGHPQVNTFLKVVPNAGHNTDLWRSEFEQSILWLFAEEAKNLPK